MEMNDAQANALRTLSRRISLDWETTRSLIKQAQHFAERIDASVDQDPENADMYAVALLLQHIYTSIETLFERVATHIDGTVPKGANWHRELLEQMEIDVPELRPALIGQPVRLVLDELRRFRHVVRNAYEHPLRWTRMRTLVEGLDGLSRDMTDDLNRFRTFLADAADAVQKT